MIIMNKNYALLALSGALLLSVSHAWAEGKDGIAATVNGKNITVAEIRDAYNMNPTRKLWTFLLTGSLSTKPPLKARSPNPMNIKNSLSL